MSVNSRTLLMKDWEEEKASKGFFEDLRSDLYYWEKVVKQEDLWDLQGVLMENCAGKITRELRAAVLAGVQ